MSETKEKARPTRVQDPNAAAVRVAFDPLRPTEKPQDYYDEIKQKFAEARDLRLSYRPDGRAQYTSELTGELAKYEIDPHVEPVSFHPEGAGHILVDVHQVVRDLAGAVLGDEHVGHRFTIEDGMIQAMEVCALP